VEPHGNDADLVLLAKAEQHMHDAALGPDALFFAHRGGRNPPTGEFGAMLADYRPTASDDDSLWQEAAPPSLVIDEVERIWGAIDIHDDWSPLTDKLAAIRRLGQALGEPPVAAGHFAQN
jgi:hypothetical protein